MTPPSPGTDPDPEPEKKYTVTFDLNGGTSAAIADQMVVEGEKATAPTPEPTRGGYAFKGWYEVGATAAFDFDTPITKNITLKAKWEINTYTITFDLDGGTADPEIGQLIVEHGKEVKAPATPPTKTGHTFKYWTLDGSEFAFDTPIAKDITLKAEWEIKQYEIVFSWNSDYYTSNYDDDFVDYNTTVTKPSDPVRPGYAFKHWSESKNDSTGEFDFATLFTDDVAPSGTLKLYAIWTQLFKVNADGTLTATAAGQNLTDIVIPNEVDGITVKKIGTSAFSVCSNIESIKLPSTVTEIGTKAFYNCYGIKSFTIPGSVTDIGESAFSQCNGLTAIEIPSSVKSVGNSAFGNCTELASVKIFSPNADYGSNVFESCKKLTAVKFCDDMKSAISTGMFNTCSSLISIEIPSGVKSVGNRAFMGTGLTSVTLATSTKYYSDSFPSACSVSGGTPITE